MRHELSARELVGDSVRVTRAREIDIDSGAGELLLQVRADPERDKRLAVGDRVEDRGVPVPAAAVAGAAVAATPAVSAALTAPAPETTARAVSPPAVTAAACGRIFDMGRELGFAMRACVRRSFAGVRGRILAVREFERDPFADIVNEESAAAPGMQRNPPPVIARNREFHRRLRRSGG